MSDSKLTFFEDPQFRFVEDTHSYFHGDTRLTSVTQFIDRFKPKFDSEKHATKKADKLGVPVEDVLNEWQEIAEYSMSLGTDVHKWIEDFLSGIKPADIVNEDVRDRVNKFAKIYKTRLNKLRPVKQEFRVFSVKWGLAGTIDSLFERDSLNYVGDWKTNKKFTTDSDYTFNQNLYYPFEDLANNHHNIYSIQLSLYRLILKEEADYDTAGSFLCHIGPENDAQIYQTKDLRGRLKYYLDNVHIKNIK